MLGYESERPRIADYDAAFDDKRGPERRGDVVAMPVDEFKGWLKSGDTTKPVAAPITKADGTPFATRQSAMLSARNKRLEGVEPVQVGDGWALRKEGRTDEPGIVEVEGAKFQRGPPPKVRPGRSPDDPNDVVESTFEAGIVKGGETVPVESLTEAYVATRQRKRSA